jgi:hypothetical protein
MRSRVFTTVRLITTLAVALCLSVSLLLAVIAYRGSKETGGGGAQGDLGFFMILSPATMVIAGVTLLSVWLERRFAKRAEPPVRSSSVLLWLSVASLCSVGWDWFFLLVIWRA